MPTWLGILFACIGATGTLFGLISIFRKDIKVDATGDGELKADVKYIIRSVDDIRIDIKAQDKRHTELSERVTRVEEKLQAHMTESAN